MSTPLISTKKLIKKLVSKVDVMSGSSRFGTPITIPRTLIPNSFGNNDQATFNYTFPSDGYLKIYDTEKSPSAPIYDYHMELNEVQFAQPFKYNDSTGGSGTIPTYEKIKDEFVFVKKGMVLTGTIHIGNMPNMVAAIETTFIPIEPNV